jgi:hypothetical protein
MECLLSTWTGLIVFLDDILICSRTKEEHEQHLRMALQVLREHKFYAKLSASFIKRRLITWGTLF